MGGKGLEMEMVVKRERGGRLVKKNGHTDLLSNSNAISDTTRTCPASRLTLDVRSPSSR